VQLSTDDVTSPLSGNKRNRFPHRGGSGPGYSLMGWKGRLVESRKHCPTVGRVHGCVFMSFCRLDEWVISSRNSIDYLKRQHFARSYARDSVNYQQMSGAAESAHYILKCAFSQGQSRTGRHEIATDKFHGHLAFVTCTVIATCCRPSDWRPHVVDLTFPHFLASGQARRLIYTVRVGLGCTIAR
jgi:hypothetical protein